MFLYSLGLAAAVSGKKLFTIQPDTPYDWNSDHDFYDHKYVVQEYNVEPGKHGVMTRSFLIPGAKEGYTCSAYVGGKLYHASPAGIIRLGACNFELVDDSWGHVGPQRCTHWGNDRMVVCRGNECNVINVETLENVKTTNSQQYHSEGNLMNDPVTGRPIIVGGTHNAGADGIFAEMLLDDLTWVTLPGHQQFPNNYKKFSFARDTKDGIYMFGGEGIRIIDGEFNYGNFEKTFYYSAGTETVVDIGTDAPAPKSEIYNKMSPTHFDSLGGHSMIVHSSTHTCKYGANETMPEPSELYKWYLSTGDESIADDYLDGCFDFDDERLMRAYNELEVYNYNKADDAWDGPFVYFSSPRVIGHDWTYVFDSFWADDMQFEGDTCFNNYCEMDKQLCNDDEVCKQDWNSDLDVTILQCCGTSNDICRDMELPHEMNEDENICPSSECWEYNKVDNSCRLKDTVDCMQLTCGATAMTIEFNQALFGDDFSAFPLAQSDYDGQFDYGINCMLGQCKMLTQISGDNLILTVKVVPSSNRKRRATRLDLDGIGIKTSPFVVDGIDFQCTYGTQLSLESAPFEIEAVSVSGSTMGVGTLKEGFSLSLSAPDTTSVILGSDLEIAVEWTVTTLTNIDFNFEDCTVNQGATAVKIVKDKCYSDALRVRPRADANNSKGVIFKTFGIENESQKEQTVTCTIVLCKRGDCKLPTDDSQCPNEGSDANFKFSVSGAE